MSASITTDEAPYDRNIGSENNTRMDVRRCYSLTPGAVCFRNYLTLAYLINRYYISGQKRKTF